MIRVLTILLVLSGFGFAQASYGPIYECSFECVDPTGHCQSACHVLVVEVQDTCSTYVYCPNCPQHGCEVTGTCTVKICICELGKDPSGKKYSDCAPAWSTCTWPAVSCSGCSCSPTSGTPVTDFHLLSWCQVDNC